jgi:hypothetical protein
MGGSILELRTFAAQHSNVMNRTILLCILIGLGSILTLSACKKDKDDPAPVAPPVQPPADARAAYLGSWVVVDSLFFAATPHVQTYVMTISTGGTASDTLFFNNMWNQGNSYYAIMAGTFFSFPSQHVDGPYYMTGSGNRTGTSLTYQTTGDVYLHKGYGEKQ